MPFLFAKISFLLLLSAVLGGMVAWWLASRHFGQVGVELKAQQDEWRQWRSQIDRRLGERPEPDWTPLLQRLGSLERAVGSIRLPVPESTNLRPVLDAVASLRLHDAPVVNLEPLHARLLALEDSLRRHAPVAAQSLDATVDLSPVLSRLALIDNTLALSEGHFSNLGHRLAALETRLANLRLPEPQAAPNLQPLMASLLELQRAVAALRTPQA